MGNAFGTKENPVVLTPEISVSTRGNPSLYLPRKELINYGLVGQATGASQALDSLCRDQFRFKFPANIYSNPFLNQAELRILLYLYDLLYSLGKSYSCCFSVSVEDTDDLILDDLGNSEIFYVCEENLSNKVEQYDKNEICSLSKELEKINIKLSPPRLTGAIRKLHNFSYITVTDLNYHNSRQGFIELEEKYEKNRTKLAYYRKLLTGRSMVKHIRLSEYMDKVDLSKRFKAAYDKHKNVKPLKEK